jgi:hypothetical protein
VERTQSPNTIPKPKGPRGIVLAQSCLFAWLISHQPAVLLSQNKPVTSKKPAVLFFQNKPAPAISHQPTEQNRLLNSSFSRLLQQWRADRELQVCSSQQGPRGEGVCRGVTAAIPRYTVPPPLSLLLCSLCIYVQPE